MQNAKIYIEGMHCQACENRVARGLKKTAGVQRARVNWAAGTAEVRYDERAASLADLEKAVLRAGYKVSRRGAGAAGSGAARKSPLRLVGILLIILALYTVLMLLGLLNFLTPSTLAAEGMGYGMLFVIGLITSVHCVAMCGGLNLSQCIPQAGRAEGTGKFAALTPALLYNLGRIASYTIIGFIVGSIGSVLSFTPGVQAALKFIAALFMILMGLNMLGILPGLSRLVPRMPGRVAGEIENRKRSSNSPLIVGALNGLMPCGPLQAMQIYALSTGNPAKGGLAMLLFCLGTVPLMFGLGALSSVLTARFTRKLMAAGAVLVVVLGLSMFTQGWSLAGLPLPSVFGGAESGTTSTQTITPNEVVDGKQIVTSTLTSGRYPSITVQVGTPVKWTINAASDKINGCNYRMYISEYDISHEFTAGENVIEFTPTQVGTYTYTCWMGMQRGTIRVTEAASA
ncbi:MAG: sulfite exporter TauE/SafE family protein [Clostridiales Family XIII bacterium]|jgi:sulfite exporter TauE/SafE/copper chaperone CopZ|nr:sulfite exporter TauE/SafE family protein [Clostridiales Family XIII bacterium]